MNKHTPSPWVDIGIEPDYPRERNIKSGNLYVARTIGGLSADTELANARLIAAAPELLEALIAVRNEFKGQKVAFESFPMVLNAIAKATGEEA